MSKLHTFLRQHLDSCSKASCIFIKIHIYFEILLLVQYILWFCTWCTLSFSCFLTLFLPQLIHKIFWIYFSSNWTLCPDLLIHDLVSWSNMLIRNKIIFIVWSPLAWSERESLKKCSSLGAQGGNCKEIFSVYSTQKARHLIKEASKLKIFHFHSRKHPFWNTLFFL